MYCWRYIKVFFQAILVHQDGLYLQGYFPAFFLCHIFFFLSLLCLPGSLKLWAVSNKAFPRGFQTERDVPLLTGGGVQINKGQCNSLEGNTPTSLSTLGLHTVRSRLPRTSATLVLQHLTISSSWERGAAAAAQQWCSNWDSKLMKVI